MNKHILMPVEPTQEMLSSAMAVCTGFSGDYGRYNDHLSEDAAREVYQAFRSVAPAVQGEPVAWMYSYIGGTEVQTSKERWTGMDWKSYWEETPLYTAPQPTEQQPVSWIRIRGDHVIFSRCDWMYPASTEDSAGPRDEQRFAAVGRRDGDIVLPAPEGALDRDDLKTMLAWPSTSKPAEQQPAPDVSALVGALEEARLTLEVMQGRGSSVELTLAIIDRALDAHRKQQEGQS